MADSINLMDWRLPAPTDRAQLMVAESAGILKRFYLIQRELVLMQAGWLPGADHWQSKLLLPEVLWQDALVADEFRRRVLELRFPRREIVVGDDAPIVQLLQQFRNAPDGLAFIEGLQVVKSKLRTTYRNYLERIDHLDDAPTVRILRQALADLDEQIARLSTAAADGFQVYPERHAPAQQWTRGTRTMVEQLGDLLDLTPRDIAMPAVTEFGGREFAISRTGARDRRFNLNRFGWPDNLDRAIGPGVGLLLQVRQSVHHLNELWAAEMAAACLFDLAADAEPEFLTDAARWCFDEIRHCRMGFTRLTEWGFPIGEMSLGTFPYDAGADAAPLTRLAMIFYFESTYIHTKPERAKIFGEWGDAVSSHDMDFDWADEQIHTHLGTRWLKYFLEKRGDPRRPTDVRPDAEACVKQAIANAPPGDRAKTQAAFETMMTRARQFALKT
ncbi:MAG: DUF455 family protein [Chloroflexi bacterium]|nr:DUF455 family protein [Chloroflexota bacterium]